MDSSLDPSSANGRPARMFHGRELIPSWSVSGTQGKPLSGALKLINEGTWHGRTLLGRTGCTTRGWEFGREKRTTRQREDHCCARAAEGDRARAAPDV